MVGLGEGCHGSSSVGTRPAGTDVAADPFPWSDHHSQCQSDSLYLVRRGATEPIGAPPISRHQPRRPPTAREPHRSLKVLRQLPTIRREARTARRCEQGDAMRARQDGQATRAGRHDLRRRASDSSSSCSAPSSATRSGTTAIRLGTSGVVGLLIGAAISYVVGGVVGRILDKGLQRGVFLFRKSPPGEIFAATIISTSGMILGLIVGHGPGRRGPLRLRLRHHRRHRLGPGRLRLATGHRQGSPDRGRRRAVPDPQSAPRSRCPARPCSSTPRPSWTASCSSSVATDCSPAGLVVPQFVVDHVPPDGGVARPGHLPAGPPRARGARGHARARRVGRHRQGRGARGRRPDHQAPDRWPGGPGCASAPARPPSWTRPRSGT